MDENETIKILENRKKQIKKRSDDIEQYIESSQIELKELTKEWNALTVAITRLH